MRSRRIGKTKRRLKDRNKSSIELINDEIEKKSEMKREMTD